jgi:thioredoxin-like negative regulator of GroEL
MAPPSTLAAGLGELARVPPAPYVPLAMRGGPEEEALAAAMGPYVKGDYGAAAAGLKTLVGRRPSSLEARFYLGVSELLAGDAAAAATDLQAVADAPDATLRDHALYYRAKAALAMGRVDEARTPLATLAAGSSEYAARAQDLLRKLDALPSASRPESAGRRDP